MRGQYGLRAKADADCSIGCCIRSCFLTFGVFRIFRYLTFRTAFASLTALLIGLLIGPFVIERLREFQIGQYVREDGPQTHLKKGGTPTMGGVLICISILVPTLLWADLSNPAVWMAMLSTLAFGAIGFADDYIKVVKKRSMGLTARAEAGAAVAGERARWRLRCCMLEKRGSYSTRLMVPFVKKFRPDLVWEWMGHIPHMHWLAFLPFVVFVMLVITRSEQRGEPDRRAGWAGDRLHDHRGGRAGGADVRQRPRGVFGLPGAATACRW